MAEQGQGCIGLRAMKLLRPRRPKLIPEWKRAWKLFSVQAQGVGLAILGAYAALPEKMQDSIPSRYVLMTAAACFILGIIGRLVHQEKPK